MSKHLQRLNKLNKRSLGLTTKEINLEIESVNNRRNNLSTLLAEFNSIIVNLLFTLVAHLKAIFIPLLLSLNLI